MEAQAEGAVVEQQQQEQQGPEEQPTSLSFLQLHDAFKRMVAVGVDVVDEQTFCRVMEGVPDVVVWALWQLYMRIVSNTVDNALAEFDDIAADHGLAQQMADLEALALQRGFALAPGGGPADASVAEDPAAGPAAAAAAARVAAKRAEKQQLAEALARLRRDSDDLQAQVDARRRAAGAAKAAFGRVADQMTEVHSAVHSWRVGDAIGAPDAAA